ncbi:MAG: T9SS type A sorting domain-containing protein [Candidatus Kapabacteria bacterium]|nr:T9SS type A sorting domain-containing protein [Candidatus Kapabacteria bacterium]
MQRWFRLSSLLLALTAAFTSIQAQDYVEVRGSLPPGQVRVFVRDTVYRISGTFTIGGTLVIEPGTRVEFLPNGRLIDSTGGRIIADGRASATYNANAVNALFPPYTGYDDTDYFGAPGVVTSNISTEPTIHQTKESLIFSINLGTDPNLQNLTPAKAVMYKAARLERGFNDPAIRLNPWFRGKVNSPIDVTPARITFTASGVNSFSREWGHIIVLPGARAAFFRDVDFLNFRKDTTVDNEPIYLKNQNGTALTRAQQELVNDNLLRATNGGGGAITTFSSRTWIVGCLFRNNMARYRGGALQVLQAPVDQYAGSGFQVYPTVSPATVSGLGVYDKTVNPWVTDRLTAEPIQQNIVAIDNVNLASAEGLTDDQRQSLDDGRVAMYLGRIRQSRFVNNRVVLADVDTVRIGALLFVTDVDNRAATTFGTITRSQKNDAHGGAVYIAGRSSMVVGLGINDFQGKDTIEFTGNTATNRQGTGLVNGLRTNGARGGALYLGGDSTHLIVAGRYQSNSTSAPFITTVSSTLPDVSLYTYSQGGAIYTNTTAGQLQIRGGLDVNPATHFIANEAARGGAVFVSASTDTLPSPVIGGGDGIINSRNYGFNIKFRDNKAAVDGGAVFTARNMHVYGAGGVSGPLAVYGSNYSVEFSNNTAGWSGGAVSVMLNQNLPIWRRALRYIRASFVNNSVGQVPTALVADVRGGGALYTINADLNVVKGSEFRANRAWNGNGGAIAVVTPDTLTRTRFMVSDLDEMLYDARGVATGYVRNDAVFTFQTAAPLADERMLTRFYDNIAVENPLRMGNGTTQRNNAGNLSHPGANIRENGTGLGGAIYILDSIRVRVDTFAFDRVRFQSNTAYTGAAIYSDNYDLKLAFTRSLVTGNKATSGLGRRDDEVAGPLVNNTNVASSDLAGAVLYGEVVGPLPWTSYSAAANSIYDNDARFTIRLPDAQDTKGVLAGTTGVGFGGVDTLRGNYWGRTEANVSTILPLTANNTFQRIQETFFIAGNGKTHMRFLRNWSSKTEQGPFESTWQYSYEPIDIYTIPDTLLMAGRVYDIFDKGTDIKTADYSRRRMAPIEDFAVGIPPRIKLYNNPLAPSYNKYIKRMTRNPFDADVDTKIAQVQTEFVGDHPIGYPVFLEARVDYSQTAEVSNNDARSINESVFFAVNERTGDYIRLNLRQRSNTDTIFRARLELVPDSVNAGDPNIRRSYEGLASYGTGATLLSRLAANADAEDSSALAGRRWEGSTFLGELGGPNFRLGNRPALPANNAGKETYYGGERYRALPVVEGDVVTIVSRTVLWKEGVIPALAGALQFTVGTTTEPPVFTGSADTLGTSPNLIPEMRNRVFVTENRLYTPITRAQSPTKSNGAPWFNEPPSYPADADNVADLARNAQERDSIFTITATDVNRFYDPRVVLDPNANAQLAYMWNIIDPNSALKYWLRDTLITAASNNNPRWGAVGYRMLRGRPINPYVVPGGEEVEVIAKNFPPSIELVDSLRSSGVDEATISKWIYLYPSYFHAEEYDNNALAIGDRNINNTNARFLQQDTVDIGWNDETKYRFRIYVVDSMPRFVWAHRPRTGNNAYAQMLGGDTSFVLDPVATDPNTYNNGEYLDVLKLASTASRVGRRLVAPNAITDETYNDPAGDQADTINIQFVANLTDQLRFKLDVNTDDEGEDAAAIDPARYIVQKYGPWDFRYGKTAYGFQSTAVRETPGDTTIDEVVMSRPIWMSNRYMRRFADANSADPFAEDFATRGQLNIRIPAAEARQILTPQGQYHGDLNTDTLVTIVVNDGHGGVNYITRRLFVNVQPEILDPIGGSLPEAIEDTDYNTLLDSARMIRVYDPNFGQARDFELIYAGDPRDSVEIDPYFPEAGSINLADVKTTPNWLKINRESGLLYGTPRVTDLPYADTVVQVTVLVTDRGNLKALKTFPLTIRAVNHDPDLLASPVIRCVELNKAYEDEITVTDIDLARTQAGNEELTFEVVEPAGSWTFEPARIASPVADTQKIKISTTNLSGTPDDRGRLKIVVRVTDKQGATDDLIYYVSVSAETRFTNVIRVTNTNGAFQDLTWGVGGTEVATRGDEQGSYGKLDSNYCEYEIPPVAYVDVFDARWTIPNRTGTLRNIYPFSNDPGEAIYRSRFQAGGEIGQASNYYPVKISWCRATIPAKDATNPGTYYIRDDFSSTGSLFSYNMKTGAGTSVSDIYHTTDGSCDTLTIVRTTVEGFVIVYDFTTSVDEESDMTVLGINNATPNPLRDNTVITYTTPDNSNVKVEIFDALGSKIATLADGFHAAGKHTIDWNASMVSNGVYTIRISNGSVSATQQIVVVR